MLNGLALAEIGLQSPSRLREGLGEGVSVSDSYTACGQALPRPLPRAGGEQ
jgi:hypothetical protein